MKKFLAMILALVLVFSMSTVAFAATTEKSGNLTAANLPWKSDGKEVNITIGAEAIVYNVDIVWQDLTFTYSNNQTWNPDTHTHTGTSGWDVAAIDNAIVVKNHSNAKVTVSTEKTAEANNKGVEFYVTTAGSETLNSAVGTAVDEAPSVSYKVELGGNAPNDLTAGTFKIGTITVKIDAAA